MVNSKSTVFQIFVIRYGNAFWRYYNGKRDCDQPRKTRSERYLPQLEELVLEYLMRQKNMISMQLDVTQSKRMVIIYIISSILNRLDTAS